MAAPYSPKVELYLGAAWVDVSGDVRYQSKIVMTRGRDNEGGQGQPSTCDFTLDDTSGNYNPQNPNGAYYGTFGRNTPCRVSIFNPRGGMRVSLDPSISGYASCPDSAGLSITGDIDLRGDAYVKNFRPAQSLQFVSKVSSYRFYIDPVGTVTVQLFTDAGGSNRKFTSTATLPHAPGRISLRVTVDVDNGAAGATANFYYSTTTGTAGPWTALGTSVTTAGTIAIYDSTGILKTFSGSGTTMDTYSLAVYSGIAGTLKANPRFDSQTSGTTSFADAQGNTWTLNGAYARLDDRDYRFWGEISEWPASEDSTGRNRTVSIRAAGPLRRVLAGSTVVKSAMSRAIARLTTAVAWWPAEDGSQATAITSGIARQPNFTVLGADDLIYGSDNAKFPGTASLLQVPSLSMWTVNVAPYTDTNETQFRFLLEVPEGGYLDGTVMWSIYTTGTIARWDLVHHTPVGSMGMNAYAADGTLIGILATADFGLIGKAMWVSIEFTYAAGSVTVGLSVAEIGSGTGGGTSTSFAGTFGVINRVQFNWGLADFSDTLIGQILIENDVNSIFSLVGQIKAYADEAPETRLARLITTESGLRYDRNGTLPASDDNPLGYQTQRTMAELLREVESQDQGIIYDMTEFNGGIAYRPRDSMYNTDVALTLVYTGNDASGLQSTTDDQRTENDVTVTRAGGGSSNAVDTTTVMSVSDPGSGGVGRYEAADELSLAADSQTLNHAGWRLHLGTVAEPRWPVIEVWAERSALSSAADQSAISALGLGDHIRVTSVPVRRLLWDIDALVIGMTEELDQFQWHLTFVTVPERPFHVLEWDTDRRWSPDNAATNASITSSATSFAVKTNSGDLWTTAAGDFPLDVLINGERITVGAISGASSPQTFSSCTRAVNGVTKAHSADEAVTLWDPCYYAI